MACYALGSLLWSGYCAYASGVFAYNDYGRYTNMIWNSAHGHLFQFGTQRSYLEIHLSFTLALLGPLYHLFDDASLLLFLQWGMLAIGTVITWAFLRRSETPPIMAGAVVLFFVAYPFTQGVQLDQFHTVGLYFLLVPWLAYTCRFRKYGAWIPLLLILGVREDAFIFVIPPLLYFGWSQRWRAGYIMACLAFLYGVIAIFVLYPAITGNSIFVARASYIGVPPSYAAATARRLSAIALTLLPLVLGAPLRSLWPTGLLILGGLLPALLSQYPQQQRMGTIYAAPVMVWLPIVLSESWTRARRAGLSMAGWRPILHALLLLLLVYATNRQLGFIADGKCASMPRYRRPSLMIQTALPLLHSIPRTERLLLDGELAGLASNREYIFDWKTFKPTRDYVTTIMTRTDGLAGRKDGILVDYLKSNTFGIVYTDGMYTILKRGADPAGNESLLTNLPRLESWVFMTLALEGGRDIASPWGPVRYWEGDASKSPVTLSYHDNRLLPAGHHCIRLHYHVKKPLRNKRNSWGRFSLHQWLQQMPPLVEAELRQVESRPGELMTHDLVIELDKAQSIEYRVTGEDAELWLQKVEWDPPDAQTTSHSLPP